MPFWEVAICVSMKDRPSGRNPPSSNRLKITMKTAVTKGEHRLWRFLHPQLIFYRLWLLQSELVWQFGELSISWKDMEMTIPEPSPRESSSSWLIKGNKKKGKAQSRRYQRQSTRINCDFTRLVL